MITLNTECKYKKFVPIYTGKIALLSNRHHRMINCYAKIYAKEDRDKKIVLDYCKYYINSSTKIANQLNKIYYEKNKAT
jgi:hypothetical protein